MSKKSKGQMVLDLGYEDAKARMKYQTLIQDYQELRKEVDVIRSKLEAGKQRKMMLAAEVRFLRRRYKYFVETKTLNPLQREKLVQQPNLPKQTKHMRGVSRKEAGRHTLLPIPQSKREKKHYIGKESAALYSAPPAGQHHRKQSLTPVAELNDKGRIYIKKKAVIRNVTPVINLNHKERMHANEVAFDLNQENSYSMKEVSLPSRPPIFDLNEISTGDEDFQSNFEEVKKNLMRGPNDEVRNDLMLSVCRNAGDGPSRVGRRKISWQDPVALRV